MGAGSEGNSLGKDVHGVLPYLLHFSTIRKKIRSRNVHKNVFKDSEFREKKVPVKATLYLEASINLYPYVTHLLCDFREIRYESNKIHNVV